MEHIARMWKEVVQDETGPGLPEGAMGSVKGAQCLLEMMSFEKGTGAVSRGIATGLF